MPTLTVGLVIAVQCVIEECKIIWVSRKKPSFLYCYYYRCY